MNTDAPNGMSTQAAAATETVEQAGNMSLAQLGKRMNDRRKASSKPAATATAAPTAEPSANSEQADEGEAGDLSQSAETDSAALSAEAGQEAATENEAGEGTEGTDEARAKPEKPVRDLQKRVGKLVEQREELKSENEELRARIKALETSGPTAAAPVDHPGNNGFAGDRQVTEINSNLKGVDAFLDWADQNELGGSFEENGKTYELTAEDVKSYRRQCEKQARELTAKREARLETLRGDFNAKRATAHAEAVRLYPWVEQKASAEFQEALAIIRENPGVLERPDFELIVARQVVGTRLEREAARKVKPAGAQPKRGGTTPPPVVTHSPNAAGRGNPRQAADSAAETTFQQTGRVTDLSKLLAQRRQTRLTPA